MASLTTNNNHMDKTISEENKPDIMKLVKASLGGKGECGEPPPEPLPPPQSPVKPPLPPGPRPCTPPPPIEQPFEFTEEMIATMDKVQCRDYFRGTCTRKNCQYRHFLTKKEFKENVQFCHDFQNKRDTGCRRQNCIFVHCTIMEENEFHHSGILSQKLMKLHNFDRLHIVDDMPDLKETKVVVTTHTKKTRATGRSQGKAANRDAEDKRKTSTPLSIVPPLPPEPPCQPPVPPFQPPGPPTPPSTPMEVTHAQMMDPLLPPMQQPVPVGAANQEILPDLSKPPPSLAPPAPQQVMVDGRFAHMYYPAENPTFRQGHQEFAAYPMPGNPGPSQPAYPEPNPQPPLRRKRNMSPPIAAEHGMHPPPPPGYHQPSVVQCAHPNQPYAGMEGSSTSPINGGVMPQSAQDGRPILPASRAMRGQINMMYPDQGDLAQAPVGINEAPTNNGAIPPVYMSSAINMQPSHGPSDMDEPDAKKGKHMDPLPTQAASSVNSDCKKCLYLEKCRQVIEDKMVSLEHEHSVFKEKNDKLKMGIERMQEDLEKLKSENEGLRRVLANSATLQQVFTSTSSSVPRQANCVEAPCYVRDSRGKSSIHPSENASSRLLQVSPGSEVMQQSDPSQNVPNMVYNMGYGVPMDEKDSRDYTMFMRQQSAQPQQMVDSHQKSQPPYWIHSQQQGPANSPIRMSYQDPHMAKNQQKIFPVEPKPPPPPLAYAYRQQMEQQPAGQQKSQPQMGAQQAGVSQQHPKQQEHMSQAQMPNQQQQQQQQQQMYQQQYQQACNNQHLMYAQASPSDVKYLQP